MTLSKISIILGGILVMNSSYAQTCYQFDSQSPAYQTCMLRAENSKRAVAEDGYRKKANEIEEKEALDRRIKAQLIHLEDLEKRGLAVRR